MPTAEAALLALRQQQVIAEETGVDRHGRPARRLVVRRVADQRGRAPGVALPRRDRPAGRHGRRRSPRATRSARSPTRPTASSASSTPASAGSSGVNAYVDAARGHDRARARGPRGLARGATWRGSSGRAGSATPAAVEAALARPARRGRPPGLVGHEPDAALHPLRRGVRDARRDVRRPARRLRRVPRAGRRSESVTLELLGPWSGFFTAAAGASAVLLGLVFVAMSIHYDTAIRPAPRRDGHRERRAALLRELVSLVMLVPPREPWVPTAACSSSGSSRRSTPGCRFRPVLRVGRAAGRPRTAADVHPAVDHGDRPDAGRVRARRVAGRCPVPGRLPGPGIHRVRDAERLGRAPSAGPPRRPPADARRKAGSEVRLRCT